MGSTGNKQLAFVLDRGGDIVDIADIASFAVRLQEFVIRVVDVGFKQYDRTHQRNLYVLSLAQALLPPHFWQ